MRWPLDVNSPSGSQSPVGSLGGAPAEAMMRYDRVASSPIRITGPNTLNPSQCLRSAWNIAVMQREHDLGWPQVELGAVPVASGCCTSLIQSQPPSAKPTYSRSWPRGRRDGHGRRLATRPVGQGAVVLVVEDRRRRRLPSAASPNSRRSSGRWCRSVGLYRVRYAW